LDSYEAGTKVENMEPKNKRWWKSPGGVVVVLLLGSMSVAGVVQATPPAGNPGQPFQEILDAIDALSDAQTQIAVEFGAQVDDIQNTVNDIEDKLDVLDVEAIGTEAFADPGEDPVADIPVNNALILVRVTWKGEGISGLTAADFTIATRLVPAGECALEIDEVYTFGSPNGDYGLAVTPIDTEGCDWAAGSYISSLEVSSGGMKGSTLVEVLVT
jgi:hypothetical protein